MQAAAEKPINDQDLLERIKDMYASMECKPLPGELWYVFINSRHNHESISRNTVRDLGHKYWLERYIDFYTD